MTTDAPATGLPSGSRTCPRKTSESARAGTWGRRPVSSRTSRQPGSPARVAVARRDGSSAGSSDAAIPSETPATARMKRQAAVRIREIRQRPGHAAHQGGDGGRHNTLDRPRWPSPARRRRGSCSGPAAAGPFPSRPADSPPADRPDSVERNAASFEPAPQPAPCPRQPRQHRAACAAQPPRGGLGAQALEVMQHDRSAEPLGQAVHLGDQRVRSPDGRHAGSPPPLRATAVAPRSQPRGGFVAGRRSTLARTAIRRAMRNSQSPTDSRLRMLFALRTSSRNVAWKASWAS